MAFRSATWAAVIFDSGESEVAPAKRTGNERRKSNDRQSFSEHLRITPQGWWGLECVYSTTRPSARNLLMTTSTWLPRRIVWPGLAKTIQYWRPASSCLGVWRSLPIFSVSGIKKRTPLASSISAGSDFLSLSTAAFSTVEHTVGEAQHLAGGGNFHAHDRLQRRERNRPISSTTNVVGSIGLTGGRKETP